MLKKINRFLKLFGFNLVHAKKIRIVGTRTARVSKSCIGDGITHYVGDECDGGHNECGAGQPKTSDITGPTS